MSYLGVMVDMAGCPNRCRHCWLGSHKNGSMKVDDFRNIADQFKNWRDENEKGIRELGFFSWWREPDYRDDYRDLWALEQELSSPGQAQHGLSCCQSGGWRRTRATRSGQRHRHPKRVRSLFSAWKTTPIGGCAGKARSGTIYWRLSVCLKPGSPHAGSYL